MGLVNFTKLFDDPEWLAKAKVPVHTDNGNKFMTAMMNKTSTLFVDVAFLLTSGRDMHFGSAYPFIYDHSDNDANRIHNEKLEDKRQAAVDPQGYHQKKASEPKTTAPVKLAYLPLTMVDLADYLVEFINKMFKNRTRMQNIVFGVDNHIHVPVTKLREWHSRDYGTNGTYESSRSEFREQLRAPFSRSDEAFVTSLIDLIEDGDMESFNSQILGLTFTRASPMLDEFLTDRYIRPYFVSLLFRLVYDKMSSTVGAVKFEQKAQVFVMHPIYDFSKKTPFIPNKWTFESGKMVSKNVCDDGLHIGEADIQLLWLLENAPVSSVIEVLSDDSDNVIILLAYYLRQHETGIINTAPSIFLWTSDERCIRMKYMFTRVVPDAIVANELNFQPLENQHDDVANNVQIFIELCMAFFKNDYYDDLQGGGASATIVKFKHVVKALSRFRVNNEYNSPGRRCFNYNYIEDNYDIGKIKFGHFKTMKLRQLIAASLLAMPVLKKDSKETKKTKEDFNNNVSKIMAIIAKTSDPSDTQYIESSQELLFLQWTEYIKKLDLPLLIKQEVTENLADIMNNVLYESQLTAYLQNRCAAYAANNKAHDIFGRDMQHLKKCEPSKVEIPFLRTVDDAASSTIVNRPTRGRTGSKTGVYTTNHSGSDDDIRDRERCLDVDAINSAVIIKDTIFPAEFSQESLSRFAGNFEWLLTYWSIGYFVSFSKQCTMSKKPEMETVDKLTKITVSLDTIDSTVQMLPLLYIAGYSAEYTAVPNNKFVLSKIRRRTATDTLINQTTVKYVNITIDTNDELTKPSDDNNRIKDMSIVLKRSGLLMMMANPLPEPAQQQSPQEKRILKALFNLTKTDLFRILNLKNTDPTAAAAAGVGEGRWIDAFFDTMRHYSVVVDDQASTERTIVFPDEQLAFKKAVFLMFYDDETNKSQAYNEPPYSYITLVRGKVAPSSDTASESSALTTFGPTDLKVLLMTPTVFISNFDSAANLTITNPEEFGEFRKTRNSVGGELFQASRAGVNVCERDILGELDTVFYSGMITATDKRYNPDSPDHGDIGQLSRQSLSFPYCKLMASIHPFVGSRITSAVHNLIATSKKELLFRQSIEMANGFVRSTTDAEAGILSHSLDVNTFALPLLKASIPKKQAWMESVSKMLSVFRTSMEASFNAFINWKLNQSTYLRYCQRLALRNKQTQHWRGNSYYIVKFMIDIYPSRADMFTVGEPITAKLITRTRLDGNMKDTVPKMHASWPMAFLDYNNQLGLLDNSNNAARLASFVNINEGNELLQLLSLYFPSCVNLFVSIGPVRNAAGEVANSAMQEIKLFFKNWPEHLMLHYLFYCMRRLFITTIKPRTDDATFREYISNPFLPIMIGDVLHGFKITILYN